MRGESLVAYSCLLFFIVACGKEERPETYLAQAQNYSINSQYKESVIALKNAVRLAPNNSEIRFRLGQTYLLLGSALDAVKELEKARTLNYSGSKLLPALARAYLIANDDEGILTLKGTELLPDESKVEFLAYKTLAAIRAQQLDLAEQTSEEALSLLPNNFFAMLSQAYIALAKNNIEKAEALVTKVNHINGNNPEALMLTAQIASAQQQHQQASDYYQRYEKLQPNSRAIYLIVADSLLKAQKYKESEQYANKILSLLPNQPVANYIKAAARFVENDYQTAVDYAEQAIQSGLNSPQVRLIAGASAYNLRLFEQVVSHLSSISSMLVPEHPANKMLIISQFQLGLIDDLTGSLDSFTPKNKEDAEFLSSLSFNLYAIGATNEAKKLVKKSESIAEGKASDNARQGLLKLMMNDPSGIESLSLVFESNADFTGTELALAYAALQSGQYDDALNFAKEWQVNHPDIAGSYNMLGAVYIAQKKYDLAAQTLNMSLTKDANNLFAITELAKLSVNTGDKKTAEQLALRAIEHHPENPKALRYLYAIQPGDLALSKIKTAYEKNSDNIAHTLLYIEALIDSDNLVEALAIVNTIEMSIRTPKNLWLQRLAIAKKQNNNLQFVTTLEQWLQRNPYHVEPTLIISDYYAKQRQASKALQYINKALANHHAENLLMKLIKMQLLLDTSELYQANKLYEDPQFKLIKPELTLGIEGRIAFLEKDFMAAVDNLAPFYKAYPTKQNALLLAVAQKQVGQTSEAILTLNSYLDQNDSDSQVSALLANLYLEQQPEKAIPLYKHVVESNPKDFVALNNLAWLSLEYGHLEQALRYSNMAIALAPKHANVLDTRGMVMLKSGEVAIALKTLKSAHELSNGKDINILLNYAQALIANNKKEQALAILQSIKESDSEQKQKISQLMALVD